MDGGGRYLQPMTASRAGVAGCARPAYRHRGAASSSSFPLDQGCSRRLAAYAGAPPALPLERRLPRFLGIGTDPRLLRRRRDASASGRAAISTDFIRDYGEPHHALARARRSRPRAGDDLGSVADARERGSGGGRPRLACLAAVPRRERGARAPRARSAGQAAHRCASSIPTSWSSRSPSASRTPSGSTTASCSSLPPTAR